MNASTSGSASRNSLENRCDMQPLTINFWFVRLFKPRCWCASRIASIDSSLAESMNAHVLITRTSASSARDVISIPRCNTLPIMISASTRFFAQPRLIMPTLVRCSGGRVACSSRWAWDPAATAAGEFMAGLIDRHVLVVFVEGLAIFLDLNGVRIKNPNRNMFPAEFHRAIGRGNPVLERRILAPIVHGDPEVGPFQWTNSDTILFV